MRNFNKENHRRLPGLPQNPVLTSCAQQRMLISWAECEISIWRMYKQSSEQLAVSEDTRKLLARIQIDSTEGITSVSSSPDASLLAVATLNSVKLFHLIHSEDDREDRLRVRKIAPPESIAKSGARLVAFSPNGQWLAAVTPQSEVCVARLEKDSEKPTFLSANVELERQTRKITKQSGLKKYERTINRLTFSFLASWTLGSLKATTILRRLPWTLPQNLLLLLPREAILMMIVTVTTKTRRPSSTANTGPRILPAACCQNSILHLSSSPSNHYRQANKKNRPSTVIPVFIPHATTPILTHTSSQQPHHRCLSSLLIIKSIHSTF
jgi:WD40 repeat protein